MVPECSNLLFLVKERFLFFSKSNKEISSPLSFSLAIHSTLSTMTTTTTTTGSPALPALPFKATSSKCWFSQTWQESISEEKRRRNRNA